MDKKEKLLTTALHLFVEYGFHNTPTSKIAREAGIANGTLFYFYPTKDDLVKALYLAVKGKMAQDIAVEIEHKETFHDIMRGYYSASLNWALKNKTESRFMEQFNSSPYLKQIAEEEIKKNNQPLRELLQKAIHEKIIKPLDVEIIFTLISGHVFSINQYLVRKQFAKPEQDKVIQDTFDLLWDMIT
ncbi:TetR/AcrR family transcriptional regulator [Adhaeribacter pallidiroseus]|uniref:Fatty acid metabolism regulator protein n=1 Tax=Adhaeribacter pallidiroseus TaxID=2072847 RepID=A0A369QP81_9BACT|nr:TetR/AcrR family transcriptional regulator [Adhaeribacter pallidiroseus]RDC65485.1 Fatty acid metabolism regulator protein [Adhaeribacter pallidiroseus]